MHASTNDTVIIIALLLLSTVADLINAPLIDASPRREVQFSRSI